MQTKIAGPVKFALKLQKLPIVKLHRRLKQTARRASTARHLAAKCVPGSAAHSHLLYAQSCQLAAFKQVGAEIQSRTHAPTA